MADHRRPDLAAYPELAAAATTGPHRLRRHSPVDGLDRRKLGLAEVLGQSVSATAPTAAMAATPAIAAVTAGRAAFWSFVVATVLALLVGTCIGQFTRRMAAAGSLYSITAKGLGPSAGLASGGALLLGYGALTAAAFTGAAAYLAALLPPGWPVTLPLVVVVTAVATVLIARGVRLSTRVVFVVEAVSIAMMLVIFVALLIRTGQFSQLGVPPFELRGVASGVLPALGAFIGFEAAAALGVEARRPFQTVPRAVVWTAYGSGVLYLFACYVQELGFATTPGGLAGQGEPVAALAVAAHLPWLSALLKVGIAMSFFACALATGTGLVRVLFSMGREGVLPRTFGSAHPKFRTPYVAIAVAMPTAGVIAVVLLVSGPSSAQVLQVLLTTAVFGYFVAYLLVCVAAPVFLRRIGELTPGPVLAAAISSLVLVAVLGFFVTSGVSGRMLLVWAGLVVVAGAWFGWLLLRRRAQVAEVGIYDETSRDDLLGASQDAR
ncbi:APC family permease [Amycolatopsis jejuensis]|uniref:APC family permease n=1 Tax=Amycolatopsis jejuensis TaxID=330084 RepID=UPI0009FE34E8|nr:APC family permease [Amycolatopsis jejuensis]